MYERSVNTDADQRKVTPAGMANERLVQLAAADLGLVDEGGAVRWAELKAAAPYLFEAVPPPPPGNAGSGVGAETPGAPARSMNDWLRAQALGKG